MFLCCASLLIVLKEDLGRAEIPQKARRELCKCPTSKGGKVKFPGHFFFSVYLEFFSPFLSLPLSCPRFVFQCFYIVSWPFSNLISTSHKPSLQSILHTVFRSGFIDTTSPLPTILPPLFPPTPSICTFCKNVQSMNFRHFTERAVLQSQKS